MLPGKNTIPLWLARLLGSEPCVHGVGHVLHEVAEERAGLGAVDAGRVERHRAEADRAGRHGRAEREAAACRRGSRASAAEVDRRCAPWSTATSMLKIVASGIRNNARIVPSRPATAITILVVLPSGSRMAARVRCGLVVGPLHDDRVHLSGGELGARRLGPNR